MVKESDLLQDDEFIEIQRLNSVESNGRRHSIIYDKPVPNTADSARPNDDLEIIDTKNNIIDTPKIVKSGEGDVDSVTILEKKNSKVDDELLKKYLKNLHSKEKKRYKHEKTISFFSDVDFDTRPSLLDDSVARPFITTFQGPVLEKQIKNIEKSKNLLKSQNSSERSQSSNDTDFKNNVGEVDENNNSNDSSDKNTNSSSRSSISSTSSNRTIFKSDFSGIYILMWMVFGWICIRGLVDYYVANNNNLRMPLLRLMTEKWVEIIIFDLTMWGSSFFTVLVQKLIVWGIISWNPVGRWLIVSYEISFIIFFNILSNTCMDFNWITRVFIFLHSMVFLMKMHSFAFLNGYLWNINKELNYSKIAIAKFKDVVKPDIIDVLERSILFCQYELNSQSNTESFPNNISSFNYMNFCFFPTLVYQLEYPRTANIRWWYVLEKLCAIFGIIFVMIMNAQLFIFPAADRAIELNKIGWSSFDIRTREWFYLLAELIPGLTVEYMLVFYLIWDAILNCIAELTCFADRYFYGDWWNCVEWAEFSRMWNVPVHKFLLRHVYHSSINHYAINKIQATMVTFVLSAVFHEVCMFIIYHKLRPYLFLFQLSQLPMTIGMAHTSLKNYPMICNILFIFGVCTGPSVITCLYMIY